MKQRFRIAAHIWVIGLAAGMTAVAQQPTPYRLTLQDAIQKSAPGQPERAGAAQELKEAEARACAACRPAASTRQRPDLCQRAEP